jgi:DNA-binding PucR family transcriptional regulator
LAGGERGGASIRAAVGAPGVGVEGFRASHAQALHARRVADLTGLPPGRIQYFTDIALAALATVDPQLATWFVRRELGTLAEHTDSADRISSTLAAYLDENASHARAARRLGVHENTVAYRVRQAETIIGHPVDERRLELGVALHLRNVVGPPNPA